MKFPLMFRKEHESILQYLLYVEKNLRTHINNQKSDHMDLQNELYEVNMLNQKLENRNSELSIKLATATTKANQYEGWYNDLTYTYRDSQNDLNDKTIELKEIQKEIESLNKKVDALKKLHTQYKEKNTTLLKDVELLGRVYNNMNRKLWANHEAQRQIRKLSEDILEHDKINKANLSKYLYDLSMLIGGGEEYKFIGLDEIIDKLKEGAKVEKA